MDGRIYSLHPHYKMRRIVDDQKHIKQCLGLELIVSWSDVGSDSQGRPLKSSPPDSR